MALPILTPQQFPALDKVISEQTDLAFVSGSLAAGLGNATSDVDLFVVYRDQTERAVAGGKMFILDDGRTVDLERFPLQHMTEVSELVNQVDVDDWQAVAKVPYAFLDLYYRTAIGQAFANEPAFAELQQRFRRDREALVYSAWARWQAATVLVQAREYAAVECLEDAYFQARRALRLAVNACMAAEGDGYPNHKWAFIKLGRRHGEGSQLFQRASSLRGLHGRSVEQYVGEVADLARSLGAPSLCSLGAHSVRYRWNGDVAFFAIRGQRYLVHNKVRVYRVNRAARLVCGLVDGNATLGEVSASFAERIGIDEVAAGLRVGRFLGLLQARGIVRREVAFELDRASTARGID